MTNKSSAITTQVHCLNRTFATPLIGSAGTVGYGTDYLDLQSPKVSGYVGGLVLKTITPLPLAGNPSPRICETEHGFINSIGLQNLGLNSFIADIHHQLAGLAPIRIASVAAFTVNDFAMMVNKISELAYIDMIEMNVSCPNTDYHGKNFSTDEHLFVEVVKACVKQKNHLPLIVKLSPSNNNVVTMAQHAEQMGADAVTIANTFNGLRIDTAKHTPMIANGMGGYSGPAIKPMVLALVHQVAQKIKIPIIGVGGVTTGEDVVEYLLAGASLVGVGTANFTNPKGMTNIYKGLIKYLKKYDLSVKDLIGAMKPYPQDLT